MKKIIFLSLILSLFIPYSVDAKSLKILAPTKGDQYIFGDTLNVEWEPARTGVTTILLKPTNKKIGPSMQLYGAKVTGDPTNFQGYYDYKLPEHLQIGAGEYYVELTLESGRKVKSKKFNIVNQNDPGITVSQPNYSIGKPEGLLKTYKRNAPITFRVDGFEQPKIEATYQNGFNIQSFIYFKNKDNRALQGVNATYDYSLKNWLVEMTAPKSVGNYVTNIVLYCGNVGLTSYCANKYPDSEQVVQKIPFKVVN